MSAGAGEAGLTQGRGGGIGGGGGGLGGDRRDGGDGESIRAPIDRRLDWVPINFSHSGIIYRISPQAEISREI